MFCAQDEHKNYCGIQFQYLVLFTVIFFKQEDVSNLVFYAHSAIMVISGHKQRGHGIMNKDMYAQSQSGLAMETSFQLQLGQVVRHNLSCR